MYIFNDGLDLTLIMWTIFSRVWVLTNERVTAVRTADQSRPEKLISAQMATRDHSVECGSLVVVNDRRLAQLVAIFIIWPSDTFQGCNANFLL